VTVSAGVASYPEHAETLKDLCRTADIAMYDAKEQGKNRVNEPKSPSLDDAADAN